MSLVMSKELQRAEGLVVELDSCRCRQYAATESSALGKGMLLTGLFIPAEQIRLVASWQTCLLQLSCVVEEYPFGSLDYG